MAVTHSLSLQEARQQFLHSPAPLHGMDDLTWLRSRVTSGRRKAFMARIEQAKAQRVLDGMRALGIPTKQSQRREPSYIGLGAWEGEWQVREAEAEIAWRSRWVSYHSRMVARFEAAALCPWTTVDEDPPPSDEFHPPVRPAPPLPPP